MPDSRLRNPAEKMPEPLAAVLVTTPDAAMGYFWELTPGLAPDTGCPVHSQSSCVAALRSNCACDGTYQNPPLQHHYAIHSSTPPSAHTSELFPVAPPRAAPSGPP